MRQRSTKVIVLIWVAVLTAAFVGAALFPDDDPSTDDSSGFGALAAIVGGILTVVYLAITKPKTSSIALPQAHPVRACPTCRANMECDAAVCPSCGAESRPWIRHSDAWWFQSESGAWQWLDESDGIWRWYEEGTPSTTSASDATPGSGIDPTVESPAATGERGT